MPNMLFVSKLSPEQWAEARRLRAEGATFRDIAQRFDIGASTVANRARREGWPLPAAMPASIGAAHPAGAVRRPSPATADIRRRLALRLYSVIEFRIRMMELSMQKQLDALEQNPHGAAPPAVTRDERDSFAALIESINQVTEMASEPATAADGRRKSVNPELTALSSEIDAHGLAVASEKDQFRRDIAERLGKLFPKA
jgi:hypothetical protein